MTQLQDLDEGQRAIIEKVEKLLRLAAKNPNENEAANATAKAQELLSAYNLSEALVSADGESSDGKRMEEAFKGGMYKYQRDVWAQIAALNFCLYWSNPKVRFRERGRRDPDGFRWKERVLSRTVEQHIVGRKVDVITTKLMGEYLLSTIERLSNERFANHQRFMREAVAYREGMAYSVQMKLYERREQVEEEERKKQKEAEAKMREGVSTENALTIAGFAQNEREANLDHIFGEGYSAKQRAQRAARAEAQRQADEEYTRWAEANPEEARKEQERAEKEAAKRERNRKSSGRYRAPSPSEKRQSSSYFWQGVDKGKTISIDQQAGGPSASAKRLTNG